MPSAVAVKVSGTAPPVDSVVCVTWPSTTTRSSTGSAGAMSKVVCAGAPASPASTRRLVVPPLLTAPVPVSPPLPPDPPELEPEALPFDVLAALHPSAASAKVDTSKYTKPDRRIVATLLRTRRTGRAPVARQHPVQLVTSVAEASEFVVQMTSARRQSRHVPK